MTQILFCLVVCGLLGALAGWLAKDMVAVRSHRQLEDGWRREVRQADARAGTFKNQLAEARQTEESLRAELRLARNAPVLTVTDPTVETDLAVALREQVARRDKKIELLNLQVTQSQASVASEWKSIKTLKTELAERQNRLEARGKQLGAQWTEKLEQKEHIQREQHDQLVALKQQNTRLEEDLAASKQTLSNERQRSARRMAELEKLRRKAVESRHQVDTKQRTTELHTADSDMTDIREQINESRRAPSSQPELTPEVEPAVLESPRAEDNLEQIRGIGPVLHRKLNELGIATFHQIAAWTEDDIARISPQLGAFRGRILRDDWVERAAELLQAQSSS